MQVSPHQFLLTVRQSLKIGFFHPSGKMLFSVLPNIPIRLQQHFRSIFIPLSKWFSQPCKYSWLPWQLFAYPWSKSHLETKINALTMTITITLTMTKERAQNCDFMAVLYIHPKRWFSWLQNSADNLNFPQKDSLRTRKLSR